MLVAYIILIIFIALLYNRYVPVRNLSVIEPDEPGTVADTVIVDVRDYHDSAKSPVDGAINIPCGYLHRHIQDIPKKDIMLIASNPLEKNFGARFLKKRGYQIKGYTLTKHLGQEV